MTVALVTGAGGFVGGHLCRRLSDRGADVRRVSSRRGIVSSAAPRSLAIDAPTLTAALTGVDVVYFLAGVAHRHAAGRELEAVNVVAPLHWLRCAERAGVRRFIWVSSIKVLGDRSSRPLVETDPYQPGDAYAQSKVDAERALWAQPLGRTTLVVVRPPLVYGPGVAGHFRTLLRWAASGVPLPLSGARAPRSLIAVGSLCDLLIRLGTAGSGTYHVADDGDVGVGTLIAEVRALMGADPGQFALSPALLSGVATAVGAGRVAARLLEPLQVDSAAVRQDLGWQPPQTRAESLAETVAWYRTLR